MKTSWRWSASTLTLTVALTGGSLALPQEARKAEPSAGQSAHVMVTSEELEWGEGPASLPPGCKAVVMEGDPKNAGLFTLRLKLPADYKIQAHWHPAEEHVTVVSGTFNMGMGDTLDTTKGKALPAGGFAVMPAKTHHFAFTKEETVIQLHGMGPWGITYVNPAHDPRKK